MVIASKQSLIGQQGHQTHTCQTVTTTSDNGGQIHMGLQASHPRMTDDGYFFVSRLRKNAVVRVLETFSLQTESNVLSDEMVVIGSTQNRSENIFRRLRILDTKGNELTLLTNRFDLDAEIGRASC